jgi:hypothetical protein
MKIFMIENDMCMSEMRGFPSLDMAKEFFKAAKLNLVEAPDHVFEGWGYMNGEFIQPTPPDENFVYDPDSGLVMLKYDLLYRKVSLQIQELKSKLDATDYKAIKYAEGLLSDEEYAEARAERQAWRNEINALEAQLEVEHD